MKTVGPARLVCALILIVSCTQSPRSPRLRVVEVLARAIPECEQGIGKGGYQAAICADGSVWLLFTAQRLPDYPFRTEYSEATDLGLFCRLIGPDGKEVVRTSQLMKPTPGYSQWGPYLPVALPNGALLVFIDSATQKDTRGHGSPRLARTTIVTVDRRGRIVRRPVGDTSKARYSHRGLRHLGSSPWLDSAGILHSMSLQDARRIGLVRLKTRGSGPALTTPEEFYVGIRDESDSVHFVTRYPDSGTFKFRRDLDWVTGVQWWAYADIAPTKERRLLVVDVPPSREWVTDGTGRRRWWPDSTVKAYRLNMADISLVDSVSFAADRAAGTDYTGASVPRVLLARTLSGFTCLVPRPFGSGAYRFDTRGAPVIGPRDARETRSSDDFKSGGQFVTVQSLGRRSKGVDSLRIDWFGFSLSDSLFHDSLTIERATP